MKRALAKSAPEKQIPVLISAGRSHSGSNHPFNVSLLSPESIRNSCLESFCGIGGSSVVGCRSVISCMLTVLSERAGPNTAQINDFRFERPSARSGPANRFLSPRLFPSQLHLQTEATC